MRIPEHEMTEYWELSIQLSPHTPAFFTPSTSASTFPSIVPKISFFSCIVLAPFLAPVPAPVGVLALRGPPLTGLDPTLDECAGDSEDEKSARLCVRRCSFDDALGVSKDDGEDDEGGDWSSSLPLDLSRPGVRGVSWRTGVEHVEDVDDAEEMDDTESPRECKPAPGVPTRDLAGRNPPVLVLLFVLVLIPDSSPSVSSDSTSPRVFGTRLLRSVSLGRRPLGPRPRCESCGFFGLRT